MGIKAWTATRCKIATTDTYAEIIGLGMISADKDKVIFITISDIRARNITFLCTAWKPRNLRVRHSPAVLLNSPTFHNRLRRMAEASPLTASQAICTQR